jgi:hypothetical protein
MKGQFHSRSNECFIMVDYMDSLYPMIFFSIDGRIQICGFNAPGSMHDITADYTGVYEKLENIFEAPGGSCNCLVLMFLNSNNKI